MQKKDMKNISNSSEYMGVLSPLDLLSTSLKREFLFFDKIAIPNILNNFVFKDTIMQCPIRSIEYLIENKIVVDPVHEYIGDDKYLKSINNETFEQKLKLLKEREYELAVELEKPFDINPILDANPLLDFIPKDWVEAFSQLKTKLSYNVEIPVNKFLVSATRFKQQVDYDRRGIALDLRKNFHINAFPLYAEQTELDNDFIPGKNDVISLILNHLPEPDYESVSWEQLIDFKNDPDTQKMVYFLRHWVVESSKGDLLLSEFSDEIEYQLTKYKEHILLQKMKVKSGVLETLFMVPAEMIEGVLRLKPTRVVKSLFQFKHKKIELLEQEAKAPGRDLAYIVKADQEFNK